MNALRRVWLTLEFSALFVALPLALFFTPQHIRPMPMLWVIAAGCAVYLVQDPSFDNRNLWRREAMRGEWKEILAVFAAGVVVLVALTAHYAPVALFRLVRTHPALWAAVMVLYPVLSVYPQGIIYRAYLMHRYKPLMGDRRWQPVLMSAAAFSLIHLIFRNPVAMSLTFVGGLIFAWRQQKTRSLFVSSVEHALYGCLVFTVGLGPYFYARFI